MSEKFDKFIRLETKLSLILAIITTVVGVISLLVFFSSTKNTHQLEVLRNQPVFTVRYSSTHRAGNIVDKNLIISAKHSEVDNLSIQVTAAARFLSSKNNKTILIPIYDYYLPCTINRNFSKNDIGFCNGDKNHNYIKILENIFENLKFQSIENYIKITCQMKDSSVCSTYIRNNNANDIRDEIAKNYYKLLQHLIEKNIIILKGFNPKKAEQKINSEFGL